MDNGLSKEQEEKFLKKCFALSITQPEKSDNFGFYNMLYDFIDENQIPIYKDEDIEREEKRLFKIAVKRGFIAKHVIKEINELEDIRKYLYKIVKEKEDTIFHFKVYKNEEESLSLSELWDKWGEISPPSGWLASYCTCGHFEAMTKDIALHLAEFNNSKINYPDEYNPIFEIEIHNIDKLIILSDGSFIIELNEMYDKLKYKVTIFQQTYSYNFT